MREYPLITYVVFAAIAGWAVLSLVRPNFRRLTNRRKAANDMKWWLAAGAAILALVLDR